MKPQFASSVLALLLLSGCLLDEVRPNLKDVPDCSHVPSEYHVYLGFDGYANWATVPGAHHLEYVANLATNPTLVRKYFHQRALDLCRSEGFSGYTSTPISVMELLDSTFSPVAAHRVVEGVVACAGEKIQPVAPPPQDPPWECAKLAAEAEQENVKRLKAAKAAAAAREWH